MRLILSLRRRHNVLLCFTVIHVKIKYKILLPVLKSLNNRMCGVLLSIINIIKLFPALSCFASIILYKIETVLVYLKKSKTTCFKH